jgi:hypothetical protein
MSLLTIIIVMTLLNEIGWLAFILWFYLQLLGSPQCGPQEEGSKGRSPLFLVNTISFPLSLFCTKSTIFTKQGEDPPTFGPFFCGLY